MDNTEESPVILSFCTGIRGLERGIERAIGPVRVAAYVEIEAFIIYNLVAAMESGVLAPTPVWSDLKTFPSQIFSGKVQGIIGGYPCQPFSNAGNRKGEEDPRHLWPYIKSHISSIRPVWCFFENVAGHLTLGFETVKRELEEMGYQVEAGIYSAEEVGAPHRRERLFILAIVDDPNIDGMRRWFSCHEAREESPNKTTTSSGELADADSTDAGRRDREIQGEAAEVKGSTCGENGEWMRAESAGSCENVSNALCDDGTEIQTKARKPVIGSEPFSNGDKGRTGRFPSRPGEHQYEWEAPRTTKSGLGSHAHGYNFREDLLRALGNGVVEQTAELAFRDLLRKHLTNGKETTNKH